MYPNVKASNPYQKRSVLSVRYADTLKYVVHILGSDFDQFVLIWHDLLQELKLIPIHYTSIKKKLIQESLSRGFLEPGTARQLLTIDVRKTDRVLDFCVSAGWVHKGSSSKS